MYLSKNSVISLFFQMHFLYPKKDIRKQGGTQFFSGLRYFLALNEFKSSEKRICDTKDKDDKQKFIKNVGHVVQLNVSSENENCDTKNFFDSFGNNDDFDTGSNFFSTAVKGSEKIKKTYPTKNPLISCEKLKINLAKNACALFAQDKSYLAKEKYHFVLLFLWLNRHTDVSNKSSAYKDFLAHLENSYSQELIKALKWDDGELQKIINEYLNLLDFDETAASLNKDDLIFDELDEKQVKKSFSVYLVANCPSSESSLRSHYVEICETTLGKKLKDNGIGDIFRYKNPEEYKNEYRRIKKIKGEDALNDEDRIVLDLYQNFLDSMPYNPNRWQYLLEKLARQKNLLMSIDSSGNRVVVQNDFILVVDAYSLFTCFKNEKFSLYQEQVKRMLESNTKWLMCKAQEEIPDNPYSNKKMMEIFESDDDKCLYFETHDSAEFENLFNELVELLTKTKGQSDFSKNQIIYYGVPGCGKSYEIDSKVNSKVKSKKEREWRVSRVVFHPDYTNADFVGQILPVVIPGERVSYKFTPGPFAKILRRAYLNPNKEFFLIIEEINRGNASAIFGDLFQLLDRIEPGKEAKEPGFGENEYSAGWSNYSIENQSICDYIRDIKTFESEKQDGSEDPQHDPCIETKKAELDGATSFGMLTITLQTGKKLIISENTQIRLPPNLSIYATMNTSDQNVFTLDNAFQRRWEMKQVPNELKNTGDAAEVAQYNQVIKNGVSWGDFRKAVNEVIMDSAQANGLSSMEDKRLGGWFFTPPDNFAEKVLKYLWDDAFKFDRPNQFNGFKTLEELLTNFNKDGFKVFKDDRMSKLQKDSSTTPNGAAQNDTPVVDG